MITVGNFSYDPTTNALSGPVLYMQERGNGFVDNALRGRSASFNTMLGACRHGQDPLRTLLVALQTDYAGWVGQRQVLAQIQRD